MFVGYAYRDTMGIGIGLEVEGDEGPQGPVGIEGKTGGVPVDQRKRQGGVGIWISSGESPDDGSRRLVLKDGRAIELE